MMGTEDKKLSASMDASVAENNLRNLDRQVETGSYLSHRSYMAGWIDLYAPEGWEDTPAVMGTEAWILKIEKNPENPARAAEYRIKPEHAMEAFKHIGLVAHRKEWHADPVRLVPSDES